MKATLSEAKSRKANKPLEVVKEGSISIPIYVNSNIIPQRDPQTSAILYETLPDGKRRALVKYQSEIYTVAYYSGSKRVRQKFSDLAKARREAGLIAIKLANGETEALKLTGGDRADYVRAMQKLREWKSDANLTAAAAVHFHGLSPADKGLLTMLERPRNLPLSIYEREEMKLSLWHGYPADLFKWCYSRRICRPDCTIQASSTTSEQSSGYEIFFRARCLKCFEELILSWPGWTGNLTRFRRHLLCGFARSCIRAFLLILTGDSFRPSLINFEPV